MAGIAPIGLAPTTNAYPAPSVYSGETPGAAPGSPSSPMEASQGRTRSDELTEEEQQRVRELKQRDTEVRRHEQAHLASAGQYARGGANFEYERGPDGGRYATGGEVSIDVSKERTPEATLRKAAIVRRAALAPADPSPQDRRVAAQAARLETKARQEIAQQQRGASAEAGEEAPTAGPSSGPAAPPSGALDAIRANLDPPGPPRLDYLV